MIVVPSEVLVRRAFALGIAVSVSACVDGQAAQLQNRDVAMFRGGAARNGVYAAAAGQALAGLQWRFVTEGDVMSSPTVLGQTVWVQHRQQPEIDAIDLLAFHQATDHVLAEVLLAAEGQPPEVIVAAGMLSSEVGLAAVPHVLAPAGPRELAHHPTG